MKRTVSRILSTQHIKIADAAIYLGAMLPLPSSSLPEYGEINLWANNPPSLRKRILIWLCSMQGLPSHKSRLLCGEALTSPFHPCLHDSPLLKTDWRFIFCGTFRQLAGMAHCLRITKCIVLRSSDFPHIISISCKT